MKNYVFAIIGLLILSSCNEKPVVIEDPRNNPEQFKKVDTLSKELQVLKQDSYLNDLDINAGMEITSNLINMFYRSETDTTNNYYDYIVDQSLNGKSTANKGISYLHLIRENDSLHYEILKNDRTALRFKFLRDSTIHEYFPENKPGTPPTVIPD
ncbi:hypothetical protein [Nonlabens antarcticus]|uniref:hypothetical protein n=1 Tax=Nonlabens antarcticus TaxID=392714 RepID=UPI0018911FCB|nr:hypothetical protein [Nonlabens antarcticus]